MLGGNDGFELLSDAFGKIGEKKMENANTMIKRK